MYDIVVIGRGPAGISAALYAVRAGMKTAVVGSGIGALEKAKLIENYYGLESSLSGAEIQKRGEKQIRDLGVDILSDEVTGVGLFEDFVVETAAGDYPCKSVILAVGKSRKTVNIPGLKELEGRGVSYCAVCDGFFYRGKAIGVLGNGDYAVNEARHLAGFSQDITIYTNGLSYKAKQDNCCKVDTRKILAVLGDDKLTGLHLEDGGTVELDGLFVAVGQASASDFAMKLGVEVVDGNIKVDINNMTNLPGVFAAGDCIGGLNQLSTAVGEGAIAGQRASEYVKRLSAANN